MRRSPVLDRLLGGGGKVFFANSGAEANECAIKLARKWAGHGRYVVVSAYGSFHGRTLATLHATGQPSKHEAFQPLPEGFRHVPWQDLEALERAITPEVAAVLLEPVQGEGVFGRRAEEYFQAVRGLCDQRGVLFMADEVQTGLGRTGRWWGWQHYGVRTRCGHGGQSPRQRGAYRSVLGARRRSSRLRPATTLRPSVGSRWLPRPLAPRWP